MKKFNVQLILLALLLTATGFRQEKTQILIVGDSISIGYTPFVKESLAAVADVAHNPGNAQHTGKGLKNIEKWISGKEWDIIQFNWGMWDLCYRHPDSKVQGKRDKAKGKITFSEADYERQLDTIVKLIKKNSKAKLIFVTTTYVPKKEAGRFTKDPKKYNKIARRVMKANGVLVNDIHKASKKIHKKYGKGNDDVHYTPKGYEELGKLITTFLKKEL